VAIPGPQHPLPKHPEKWLPKFDPDSKQIVEDHIKKFMLAIRLRSVEHEDVVCRFFPTPLKAMPLPGTFPNNPTPLCHGIDLSPVSLRNSEMTNLLKSSHGTL
jgi:hypothetical protein